MFGCRALLGSLLASGCALGWSVTVFAQTAATFTTTAPPDNPAAPADTEAPANERDPAAAEVLFRSGRQLLRESKPDEALAKFEESYRLEPTAGALFNQGECRLTQGKTASAWALYQQAATLAKLQGKPDLFELANARTNLVAGDLSYISFHLAAPVPGLQVQRDGVLIGQAQFDVALPIDPGRHDISFRAPGYEPLKKFVIIGEKRDRKNIVIPRLREQPLPLPPPPAEVARPKPVPPSPTPRPNLGPWILAGAGAASLVIGTVAGLLAIQENSNMKEQCPDQASCPASIWVTQGRRDFENKLAWVTIPVGFAALGGAATWAVLSRQPERPQVARQFPRLEATASAHDFTFNLAGAF
jgi:hypothetical protein